MSNQKTKDQKDKEDEVQGLDYELPNTKSILDNLENAFIKELQSEHVQATNDKDKEDEAKGKKKQHRRPKGGTICCCQVEGCSIGPFLAKE